MDDVWLTVCPHCKSDLPSTILYWSCPVCDHEMGAITPVNVCDWCDFGPRVFTCPSCKEPYAPFLDEDSDWDIRYGAPDDVPLEPRALSSLPFSWTDHALAALAKTPEALRESIVALEIPVPKTVDRVTLHAVRQDPLGGVWAHFWVHVKPPPIISQNVPLLQLAACARSGPEGPECTVRVIDGLRKRQRDAAKSAESGRADPRSHVIPLRQIEPFNIPTVNNDTAASFTRHLSGRETINWKSPVVPKSLMIHSVQYAYPKRSVARGWLLSVSYDDFQNSPGKFSSVEDALQSLCVGELTIEIGGGLAEPLVSVTEGKGALDTPARSNSQIPPPPDPPAPRKRQASRSLTLAVLAVGAIALMWLAARPGGLFRRSAEVSPAGQTKNVSTSLAGEHVGHVLSLKEPNRFDGDRRILTDVVVRLATGETLVATLSPYSEVAVVSGGKTRRLLPTQAESQVDMSNEFASICDRYFKPGTAIDISVTDGGDEEGGYFLQRVLVRP